MSSLLSGAPVMSGHPQFIAAAGALLSSDDLRVERRANDEASSVMTSARAGAGWSVGGSVGEAVGRWSDWGGRGVDEQPSWSMLGCRGAMARSPTVGSGVLNR
jgi:hypothetical protein